MEQPTPESLEADIAGFKVHIMKHILDLWQQRSGITLSPSQYEAASKLYDDGVSGFCAFLDGIQFHRVPPPTQHLTGLMIRGLKRDE